MKERLKNEKAITLIALVITIIVLLILAGVSISMLTGDNGILTQANKAKEETRGGAVQEARDLWFAEKNINKELNETTEKTLEDLINELVNKKHLTEDEKDIILGNASKGIEAQYQITIGSHVINFSDDENSEPDYANLEAGLYETGTSKLIKSWEQLLSDGEISIYDSCHGIRLETVSSNLEGDLVIKEGINGFYDKCFNEEKGGNTKIKALVIPSTVGDPLYEGDEHKLWCDIGNITKIFIKDGVEIIDRIIGTKLEYVRLPKTLIKINTNAFEGCNNISKVKWKIASMKRSNISNIGNESLMDAFFNNYNSYATNIINNLSTDENIRNQEITKIYLDGVTYIEKARGNIPEDVKIESLQDLWELSGKEGQCPFNNIVEVIEAEGKTYEELISMMILESFVKPKEFDQNN